MRIFSGGRLIPGQPNFRVAFQILFHLIPHYGGNGHIYIYIYIYIYIPRCPCIPFKGNEGAQVSISCPFSLHYSIFSMRSPSQSTHKFSRDPNARNFLTVALQLPKKFRLHLTSQTPVLGSLDPLGYEACHRKRMWGSLRGP